MSKEDLFTGSVEEFVSLMDKEWITSNKKKLDNLSGSLDFELMEILPREIRDLLNQSPEIVDEENHTDDVFELKTYKDRVRKGFKVFKY